MSNYVGNPYVVLSRSLSAVELYVETGEVSNDVFIFNTGSDSLINFTTEFKYSDSGQGEGVVTTLSFVDIDNKFEYEILKDSIKFASIDFKDFYYSFGINETFAPIQLGVLKKIRQSSYKGSRKIDLVLYSGEYKYDALLLKGIKSNLNNAIIPNTITETSPEGISLLQDESEGFLDQEFEVVQGVASDFYDFPDSTRVSSATRTYDWYKITDEADEGLDGKPIYYYKNFNDIIENVIARVFSRVYKGEYVLLLPDMDGIIKQIIPEALKRLVRYNHLNDFIKWMSKLGIEVIERDDGLYARIEIGEDFIESIEAFFSKINSTLTKNFIDLDFIWESDISILKILEAGDLISKDINNKYRPTLIIGDKNIMIEFLYGTLNTKVLKWLTRSKDFIVMKRHSNIPESLYSTRSKYTGELLIDLFRENRSSLTSSEDAFSQMFVADDLIKLYNKSNIRTQYELNEDLLEELQNEFILFKGNRRDSNILSFNVDYREFDFATLAEYFEQISDLDNFVADKISEIKVDQQTLANVFNFSKEPTLLIESVTKSKEEAEALSIVQKEVDTLKSLNKDNLIDKDIKRMVLAKLNRAKFYINITTLPLFSQAGISIISKLVGLDFNLFKGSYGDNEDNILDRIFNGLWNVLGYKHIIANGKVQSEFTLVRNNELLFPNANETS